MIYNRLLLTLAALACILALASCTSKNAQPLQQQDSSAVDPQAKQSAGKSGGSSLNQDNEEPPTASDAEIKEEWEDPYVEREAEYHPTEGGSKKFGNARYNFWVTIPDDWQAFDRSANADGYFIECGNENIDMRVSGIHYLPEVESIAARLEGEPFLFDNGVSGFKRDEDHTMQCSYLSEENSVIIFYINYGNDVDWFEANREVVLSVAKSLRDGSRFISTEDLLTDSLGVPESEWEYYPQGIFSDFEIEWFGGQLLALEEPSMSQMASFNRGDLFACRFTYLRSFHEPIAIRVMIDRESNTGFMYYKVCDGAGGFDQGELVINRAIELPQEQCENVIAVLDQQGFWDMAREEDDMGLDGAEWIVEAIDRQGYHVVRRWSPESGGIYSIGTFLLNLCGDEHEIY